MSGFEIAVLSVIATLYAMGAGITAIFWRAIPIGNPSDREVILTAILWPLLAGLFGFWFLCDLIRGR